MKLVIFFYFFGVKLNLVLLWDLKHFGIDDSYFVSSIAVSRTRTFLSIPRSVPCNNNTSPTVVEVNWNRDMVFSSTNLLSGRSNLEELQSWGNCGHIQDAISLDIESRKLMLWILDKGNDQCPPKILSFSLFYNDIADIIEFNDIPGKNFNTLEIVQRSVDHDTRAYIGSAGDSSIIVVSLKDLRWWRLQLVEPEHPGASINADYLTESKIDSKLFFTGKKGFELYSLDLEAVTEELDSTSYSKGEVITVNVTLIGEKLGLSTALETDNKNGLNYYLTRDYAIVRWSIGTPVIAENHNVLGQSSEKIPYVSQLFTGPHLGLWALVNPVDDHQCHKEMSNTTDLPKLEERVVQIMNYNILLNELEVVELS